MLFKFFSILLKIYNFYIGAFCTFFLLFIFDYFPYLITFKWIRRKLYSLIFLITKLISKIFQIYEQQKFKIQNYYKKTTHKCYHIIQQIL
ncbi:hypothetical protein pb186bvf_014592 [Paramecium bursaria]